MVSGFPEAFVSAPLQFVGSFKRFVRPSTTPRRARAYALNTQARSLESYQEGKVWREEHPGRGANRRNSPSHRFSSDDQEKVATPRMKPRVSLTSALASLNIASVETCCFLVRSGCVRVNGEVMRNEKAKVNRKEDVLVVNGNEYGTLESALEERANATEDQFDETIDPSLLPRAQRDFRTTSRKDPGPNSTKKYNRRVDGGFYSNRRYNAGK